MNELYQWLIFGAGLWLVITSLMMKTQNMRSSMYFKVIPFCLGSGALVSLGKLIEFF